MSLQLAYISYAMHSVALSLLLNFIHRKVAHTIYSTQYKKSKKNKQTVTHAYTHTHPRKHTNT